MQHQILALLSLSSYCDRKKEGEPIKISIEERARQTLEYYQQNNNAISNWQVLTAIESGSGLQAVAYGIDLNNDEIYEDIVIAYSGTEKLDFNDYIADLHLLLSGYNTQIAAAMNFYLSIINNENYATANITLTGHSLGGAIVQDISSKTAENGVTFNAPGINNITTNLGNIINYVNINDPIGCYRNSRHTGQTLYYYYENSNAIDAHKYFGADVDYSKYKACSTNFQEKWGTQHAITLTTFENGKGINNNNDFYLQETVNLLNNYYYSESEKTEVREFISANNRYVLK